ncbi:hypothetical protein BDQ17DRAFT_1277954 [Cyathus striatus]|nr:hypothetical protein BDQ17DRAFT_1277954 [Cyathus striatus]
MSDAFRLFKVPPHPVDYTKNFWATGDPKVVSNRMQKMVKHYFVDFGLSSRHPPGSSRLEYPGYGGTRSVPEFQNDSTELCDPFTVDVYCMGEFMRTRFRKVWVEFLDDLITDMVQDDPKKRPTMDQVVERFSRVVDSRSTWKLMSRAGTVDETQSERVVKSVKYWILRLP